MAFTALVWTLKAQDYKVLSMESLPLDMTAREHIKQDERGRQCAVFRIATQNITPEQRMGFHFECDWNSFVVERQIVDGQIWVWVSPGLKTLKIKHTTLGQWDLHTSNYAITVEALHTYKIVLQGTMAFHFDEKPEETKQYLTFQISPANAFLEVNGELWEVAHDGSAVKFVDFGTYNYRVQAPNYHTVTGMVTVNEEKQKIPITLKPDFVEVTLKVDADAEIWVNNEKKGTRSWTGSLGKGVYRIECKQANHETTVTTQEITKALNGQVFTLPSPRPIYGSLNIESTPTFAMAYIDGKMVGETPLLIKEILIGTHEVKLTKEGHEDYVETITITKGVRKQVKAMMENIDVNGFFNGHEYVDLGLPSGTLWATCNVGADAPEDYGSYFAWGETQPKRFYDWSSYKYSMDNDKLTKYCSFSDYGYNGFTDNLTTLQASDDAATVNWGNGWRMPTWEEWQELFDNTTYIWTTQNGVDGQLFTASNGNGLFIPAAGIRDDGSSEFTGSYGIYWLSSLYYYPSMADALQIGLDEYYGSDRCWGQSVRPVRSARQN